VRHIAHWEKAKLWYSKEINAVRNMALIFFMFLVFVKSYNMD
jgi:hypothetical protein